LMQHAALPEDIFKILCRFAVLNIWAHCCQQTKRPLCFPYWHRIPGHLIKTTPNGFTDFPSRGGKCVLPCKTTFSLYKVLNAITAKAVNLMEYGFVKAACATPQIRVADCTFNAQSILECVQQADASGVEILCLPELCLTGYTCGDLFFQDTLLNS